MPTKVRHFIWRCLHNALAVLVNLNNRHLDVNPICSFCHKKPETVEHVMFQCKLARQVWHLAPLPFHYAADWGYMTFEQWWTSRLLALRIDGEVKEEIGIVAFLCWSLWKSRNKEHFEKQPRDPSMILEQGVACWLEYKSANEASKGSVPAPELPHKPIWIPPDTGIVKFNVDGALDERNGLSGVGIVARDEYGNLLGAVMESFKGLFSVRTIEAMGFRCALELAL